MAISKTIIFMVALTCSMECLCGDMFMLMLGCICKIGKTNDQSDDVLSGLDFGSQSNYHVRI